MTCFCLFINVASNCNFFLLLCQNNSIKFISSLTFRSLPVTSCTNSLTFNNCTLCPHCIYVFCIYLRTNSDLCHLQHKLIGFYNRDEKCLLCGKDWVFKYSSLCFVCKGLNQTFRFLLNIVSYKLIGFYNRDEKCLQRGTNWVFKYSSLCFVCKGLNQTLRFLLNIVSYKLIGFYNRDEKCLQRGTNWVFKYSGLPFVCKGLILLPYTCFCLRSYCFHVSIAAM